MTDDPSPPPPDAPKRRSRWRRRLLTFVLVLIVLVVAAPFAVGIGAVRRAIAEQVSAAVGRRVTIGGASAAWWSGIELRDVEVHNPRGYSGPPLLAVDRVHVDVAVFRALCGSVDASIAVEKPVVTLIRGVGGESNLDGLGSTSEKRSTSKGTRPRVRATVRDGRLDAFGAAGAPAEKPDVMDQITLDADWGPGGLGVRLTAVARGAGLAGADVPLSVEATLDGAGAGPVEASVPSIDLAQIGKTLGAALGIDAASGSATLAGSLALDADGGASGRIDASLRGVSIRRGDGTVSIEAATLAVTPSPSAGGTRLDIALAMQSIRATGFSRRDAGFSEPLLKVSGSVTGRWDGDLQFGDASAPLRIEGRTLSGSVSGTLRRTSSAIEAEVSARIAATLSPTLGRLLGVLSSPDDDLAGAATVAATVKGTGGPLSIAVDGECKGLAIGGAGGAAPWTEPSVTLGVAGTWDGATSTLSLSKAALAAGAVTVRAEPGFTLVAADPFTVHGDATADADLSRLAGLKALVPTLSSVAGGRVRARLRAAAEGTLSADWTVRGDDLQFTPGTLSSRGYAEKQLAAAGRFERGKDGASVVTVSELSSALVALAPGRGPVRIRLAGGVASLDGVAVVTLDLGSVGTAFDRALHVAAGERMEGRLDLTLSGASSADGARLDATVSGRDVLLPGAAIRGSIDGRVVVATSESKRTTSITDATLRGFGLDVHGSATLSSAATGPGLLSATADWTGDLASARPLLGIALGLAPEAALAGTARGHVDAKPSGAGTAVAGTATIERFRYVGARDPATGHAMTIEEPSIAVSERITLDAEPGLLRVDEGKLTAQSLSATVTGSTREQGGETAVDLSVALDGDLVLLAKHLGSAMGPSYDDAAGEGRLVGRLTVAGSTANGGRDLRISGDLSARQLSANGVTVSDLRAAVTRPAPATMLSATVTSQCNRGTLRADGTCDLGRGASPWAVKVVVRGLDTSPLVTKRGAGHALALVLPAILPADATTSVLSGLLDADLDLRSTSLSSPAIADTLSGPGSVRMTQGTVKESTLFGALAGGGGKVMGPLLKVVPSVGKQFEELSRALLFDELSSTFTVGGRQIALNPVTLVSPSVSLRFTGTVGFDGTADLDIPLVLGGTAGKAIEKYVKNRTIPLEVKSRPGHATSVTPKLKLEDLGLAGEAKDLLDDLLKKKKKPK